MNQTKKRLSIINLAISITDIETIQLQILQLGPLRADDKIQEILTTLKAENYAQAQGLIQTYIDTPTKEILQRTFQKEKEKRTIQDNNTIDDFNLFIEPEDGEEIKTMDFDDMLAFSNEIEEEKAKKSIDFDSLLNIHKDDVLPNNIDIDISHPESKTFWDEPSKLNLHNDDIEKDTFFDTEEKKIYTKIPDTEITLKKEIPKIIDIETNMEESIVTNKIEATDKEPIQQIEKEEILEVNEVENIETFEEPKATIERKEEITATEKTEKIVKPIEQRNNSIKESKRYKAIPYIDQKFKNMHVQYPPIEESKERFASVDAWLLKISNDGYSEEEIETVIKKIDSLSLEKRAEAAQLLLITAATESKYAQFRLARTLYKGELLQKNPAESFTLINRLATNDDYPEAICDLAQFYEYGIGIDKDKKKAELLYKEAMNLGIQRAINHYERIRKENGGLFAFLKR
jgi:hypothetical protein